MLWITTIKLHFESHSQHINEMLSMDDIITLRRVLEVYDHKIATTVMNDDNIVGLNASSERSGIMLFKQFRKLDAGVFMTLAAIKEIEKISKL